MDKQTLRKVYLEKRRSLSPDEFDRRNQLIQENLFRLIDFNSVNYVHIFLPITKFKEVNTWTIIERLQKDHPVVHIVLPKVVGDIMEHYLYESKEQLKTSKWGIEEPEYGEKIDPVKIDLILTPLLVADRQGNRIGYGKGYYDRFFKECRSDVSKVGLSLLPLLDAIDCNSEWDMPLDVVVTS